MIALASGQLVPVTGDFDLASWVTGVVRSSAPRDYHPELGEVEREARYRLEGIQREVSSASFESARGRVLVARGAIQTAIAGAEIDPAGRTNALRHAAAFYDALTPTAR